MVLRCGDPEMALMNSFVVSGESISALDFPLISRMLRSESAIDFSFTSEGHVTSTRRHVLKSDALDQRSYSADHFPGTDVFTPTTCYARNSTPLLPTHNLTLVTELALRQSPYKSRGFI